jgi:5-hydroxyisourate hydrolase-like protein (transthyretin family)
MGEVDRRCRGKQLPAPSSALMLLACTLHLYSGIPASGVKVDSLRKTGRGNDSVEVSSDGCGRAAGIGGDAFLVGRYMITFDLSDHFKRVDKVLPANFFRRVSMEFEVTDTKMPLLIRCSVRRGPMCTLLSGG